MDTDRALLPHRTHHGQAGHPFSDPRPIVNGILWILHTGAPWRDLPERYGPWETVFKCFNRWRADGTWVRIATSLLDELDDQGADRPRPLVYRWLRHPGQPGGGWGKKNPSRPPQLGGPKTRKCKSRLTMRWAVPGAGLARRSIWSVTATVS